MTDAIEPLTAKAKLALSRTELLAAMGYETLRTPAGDGASVVPLAFHVGGGSASAPGAGRGPGTISRWWHRHPLSTIFELARPLLQDYAQREPVKLIAYGAGTGALLWILKPWKLLSAATVATLLVRNTDIAGVVSGLVQKARGASATALQPARVPTWPKN